MSVLRLGVMGCANIAWRAMIPSAIACEAIDLIAVASRTASRAQKFANAFNCDAVVGYEKLLNRTDIDAVYMPLPTGLHFEWVVNTLEAGKHILVEKSFAQNYETAQRMVELARAKNLLVMENFLFPHHAQHDWVNNLIARGELGEIQLFRSTFGFPPLPRDNFRYNKDLGGGALFDAGAYVVNASILFLGSNLRLLGAALKYDDELGVDIYGDAMFKSATGQIAQVSFGFNYYYQCRYALLGTQGKLTVEHAYTAPPGFRPIVRLEHQDLKQEFTLPADNQYVNMLKFFAIAVTAETDYAAHWNALLVQAKLLEAIRQERV